MESSTQIIYIHSEAPAKPALGTICNGCGVCCTTEPCPLGMVLSQKRTGACMALRWNATESRYHCGAIAEPQQVVLQALPQSAQWLRPLLGWLLQKCAYRWIAAGKGCDSTIETP